MFLNQEFKSICNMRFALLSYGDQAKRQKSHFVIRRRKPCQFNFNLGLNVEGVL